MPEPEDVHGQRHRLCVGRHQQAHANGFAQPEHWAAGQEEQQSRLGLGHVRCTLQNPAASAQHLDQLAPLTPRRKRRRQRAGTEAVAVEFIDRSVHSGHTEHSGVERLVEQCRHLVEFGVGGPHVASGSAVKAQHSGPEIRMTQQRTDIRAERQAVDGLNVFRSRRPVLVGLQRAHYELARHRLDAAEQISGVVGVGVDRRQRAHAQQHRGHAVTHRLPQSGIEQHLGVVMGVHVDEAGDDPLALRVDHLGAAGLVQRPGGHRCHDTVADPQRAGLRRAAGAVEPQTVANDHVVGHCLPPHRRGWSEPSIDSEYSQSFCARRYSLPRVRGRCACGLTAPSNPASSATESRPGAARRR